MKAAMFYGGKDIRVEEVPDPIPGPGEVLIEVKAQASAAATSTAIGCAPNDPGSPIPTPPATSWRQW